MGTVLEPAHHHNVSDFSLVKHQKIEVALCDQKKQQCSWEIESLNPTAFLETPQRGFNYSSVLSNQPQTKVYQMQTWLLVFFVCFLRCTRLSRHVKRDSFLASLQVGLFLLRFQRHPVISCFSILPFKRWQSVPAGFSISLCTVCLAALCQSITMRDMEIFMDIHHF